jgi:hypothetical protein
MKRLRSLVVCLVCLTGLAAGSPAAFGEGSPSAEGTGASFSLAGPLVIPESPVEAEQLQAEREAKLASPEAVAAREASRTKFEGLTTQQAAKVASESFPAVIDEPAGGPPKLPAGQSIGSYLTDDAAQVELGEGKHGLIEAVAPIAIETSPGQRVPVDLSLSAVGGGFEPKTPVVGVRIPKQLGEGVQLAGSGLSLTPVNAQGAALSGSEGILDGVSVLYANTQTDTDTVVKPTTAGFAADAVLRSIASPQQLLFRVGLPSGASLVQPQPGEGTAEIVKEGKTVAVVLAPYAHDAVGTAVPVAMTAAGSTLTLSVADSGEYQFPVEVDPEFVKGSDSRLVGPVGGKRSNWKFVTSSEAKFGHEPNEGVHKDEGEGKGYLETSGIAEYKETEYAYWAYQTQGVSKIYEFNAKTEGKNKGAEIESFLELEGGGASENKYRLSSETFEPEYGNKETPVGGLCAKNGITKVIECAPAAGAAGNVVRFQQSVQKKPTNFKFSDVLHEGTVYLAEPEGTHSTTKFNTTSAEVEGEVENGKKEKEKQKRPNALYGSGGWLSKYQDALEPIGEDKGIGVAATKLEYESAPNTWQTIAEHNYLTENGCEGVQCYVKHGEYLTVPGGLPNGEVKIRYRAEEALGGTVSPANEATSVATVKVDTSKPHSIALLGLPYGNELSERKYELTAVATDGEGSTIASSGIKSVVLYVDGKSIKANGTGEGTCSVPKGECTASAKYTINGAELGAGHHSIQIEVFDNAGNEGRVATQISIRHSTPVALGPGSVDLQSGDFSLGASDVSMGSGLTVSRAYSSRDLTAGSEGPLGPQWSISMTSATSLREMIDGSVTLTAANGSQTIFAAILNSEGKPTGKFESPPGDSNVELTLDENEKKEKIAYYLKNAADKTSVKFTLPTGGGKAWVPTRQEGAVKTDTVTYTWQTVEVEGKKITEPLEALAPVPAEVSCPAGKLNPGCRALKFTYATKTKENIGEGPSEWGEYNGRLSTVSYEGYNPATKKVTETQVPVVEYAYDKLGRLRATWDPRISPALKTTYGYDTEGHVTALNPPGQEPWTFTYGTAAGDAGTGRLIKVTRAPVSAGLWGGALPANTEAPKITGTPVVGVRMTVSTGAWSGSPLVYSYRWEACSERGTECTPILGANNANYTPVSTDIGHTLRAQVSAANGGGTVATSPTGVTAIAWGAPKPAFSLEFGSNESEDEHFKFSEPEGVTVSENGNIWVVDAEKNQVREFKESGGKIEWVRTFGTHKQFESGCGEGELWHPNAIVAYKGDLWVNDEYGKCIKEFNEEGKEVQKISVPEEQSSAMTVDAKGNIWYVTRYRETTSIIDYNPTTKTQLHKWGSWGKGKGQFEVVWGLAVDTKGHVWVSTEVPSKRVEEFTETGEEIRTIGGYQSGLGEVKGVARLTTDAKNNLWVTTNGCGACEGGGGPVKEFNENGEFLTRFNEATGQLFPVGVAVDSGGNIWITETLSKDRVKKFTPTKTTEGSLVGPSPGTTIEYNVPISGTGAPHEMGLNKETHQPEPEKWGQKDDPVEATAIIPPDSPQGWPASSYKRASVYYLDEAGRAVNVAQPSTSETGSIATTEYNEENDVVRTLSPANRATAVKEGCESSTKCKSAEVSHLLDSVKVYNEPNQYGEAAGCRKETAKPEKETAEPGTRLCETWGPQHEVKYIPNGYKTQTEALARNHMKYFYEDVANGAPETVEGKKQAYDLVTETTDLAELEKGSEEEVESRKSTTSYSGQSGLGWTLRAPTSTVAATETGGAKLEHKTLYYESGEAKGQVKETRGPKGLSGESAHDSRIVYYTSETNTEGYAGCGKHPEWAGLVCETLPAKQPEVAALPSVPVTTTTYNIWDEPETVVETVTRCVKVANGTGKYEDAKCTKAVAGNYELQTYTRTKTETYDEAGRLKTSETISTASTETTDKALPKVTDEYNSTTGALEKQSTTVSGKTKTITSKYNTLGQPDTYTDADGNTTTYKYGGPEKDGLIEEISDSSNEGKSNQKYTYEETTKEMTTLVDSAAGTFTASHDIEGQLTSEVYPNNMCANYTHNSVGEATHIEYIKTTNCSEKTPTVWFSENKVPSVRGEMMSRTSTLSSETYNYDTLGRLTETQETPGGEYCKTRTYAYDEESNRTSLTAREPNAKKECATEGGTEEKHTYDEANRLTDTGIAYDPLGNVTTLPAADAEKHELKSTFYVDNAVATQEQNGTKNEYFLDPNGRTRETVTGTKKTISHYDASGEAVAWTCEMVSEKCSTSTWTRNIPGIDGTLTAVQTNGGTPVLQLHDLPGNIVATAADNTTETKLLSTYNSTEFGVPNAEKTPPPFAWLGAADVQSTLSSGVITYGATSYVPQTGKALESEQVEPPGAPSGSGLGTPYCHELEPWVLQGGVREAKEAPGIGAAEEYEAALRAAMASTVDPKGLMTGAEALTLAHELHKEENNLNGWHREVGCGRTWNPTECELYYSSGEKEDTALAKALEECQFQVHQPGWLHGHFYTKTCMVHFNYSELYNNRVVDPGWTVQICFSFHIGSRSITYSSSSWWCGAQGNENGTWSTFNNRGFWHKY